MKFVALKELRSGPAKLMDRLEQEDIVVTRDGKPAAALIRLDEDSLTDFLLSSDPSVMRDLAASRKEFLAKGGVPHAAMKKRIQRRRG